MKKIAIMTDSNSGVSPEEAVVMGIKLIPMPFIVDGETNYEGVTCTYDDFFVKLNSGIDVATSQPSPGDVKSMWDEILKEYESIVYIPMSSGLSGSCQSAKALAAEYDNKVYVVDNKRISISQKQSVKDAQRLAKYGMSAKEICDVLEREAYESSIYITVNTLELLKKGGRVTKAGAALATVLNLKPVLQIQGSKLDAFKKARGMDKAKKVMLEAIRNDIDTRFKGENIILQTAYSGSLDNANVWLKEAREYFPDYEIEMNALPISICCHIGDGCVAIGAIKVL